ncbi:nucleotide disphospho-sugar-binding domain-containing protein [Phytomonospora sp. NPDC050363]|uniref:glycosyltransferase n=1 Tax=Phytomonospora sp. NPDC050363 TaxID=3155642 RepID=UPI00340D647E
MTAVRKILVLPWGNGMGHIARCMVLATALARRGAHVTVAAEPARRHAELILDGDCTAIRYPEPALTSRPWGHWDDPAFVTAAIESDLALIRDSGADAVVHDGRLSSPVAAEALGVPSFGIGQYVHFPGQTFAGRSKPPPLWTRAAPPLNAWLKGAGLAQIGDDAREVYLKGKLLIASVPEVDPRPDTFNDETTAYIGPLTRMTDLERRHPQRARGLGGENRDRVFLYRTVNDLRRIDEFIDAFADIADSVVIATGEPHLTPLLDRELGRAGMRAFDMVDMSAVMERASTAVIHGGHGTCLTMLQAGLVSVVLPDSSPERAANAQALERLGVGRSLSSGATVDSPGTTAAELEEDVAWESVRAELDRLRGDRSALSRAAWWSGRLSAYTAEDAVAHILR